jgi:hypothetical protein
VSEKLSPERAVRLLRAKAGELENWVLHNVNNVTPAPESLWRLTADIALIAGLLADHIEQSKSPGGPEAGDWTKTSPDDTETLQQEFREGFDEGRPE